MNDAVIDQTVPWCLHCGKTKMILIRKYKEEAFKVPEWISERTVEAQGVTMEEGEIVEHCWCSSCGLLYHPNSI